MTVMIVIVIVIVVATLIMPVIAVTAEIVRKDGKSARERARGRDNRSRRQ
ncbi:type II secretory pathway pseudopilin PulG [Bradyrhizobium japonicum]|nr:type II secretory pathway pseudopilin PulG [Bradyrhizobium japonicum]